MCSLIKSAAGPQRGQCRPLFVWICFSLFIPISKVPLSPARFQSFAEMDQSLSPPRLPLTPPPPKHYRRPLIVTLFICAHSEAAKLCDKWALPCASACVGGVRLFMEIGRVGRGGGGGGGGVTYSLTSPLQPRLHRHKKPEQQVPCVKISSCPLGAERGNLLC